MSFAFLCDKEFCGLQIRIAPFRNFVYKLVFERPKKAAYIASRYLPVSESFCFPNFFVVFISTDYVLIHKMEPHYCIAFLTFRAIGYTKPLWKTSRAWVRIPLDLWLLGYYKILWQQIDSKGSVFRKLKIKVLVVSLVLSD